MDNQELKQNWWINSSRVKMAAVQMGLLSVAFIFLPQTAIAQQSHIQSVNLFEGGSLWGEVDVWVSKDGNCFVREVRCPKRDSEGKEIENGMQEERYKIMLTPSDISTLESLLTKYRFYTLKIKERSGVPDEEHTQIKVALTSGKKYSVWRWTLDKHPRFEPVLKQLSNFLIRAKKNKPFFQGEWDGKYWSPAGK